MARLLSTLALAAVAVAGDCAAWASYRARMGRAGSGGAFWFAGVEHAAVLGLIRSVVV